MFDMFYGGLNGDDFDPWGEDDSQYDSGNYNFKPDKWYYHYKVYVDIIHQTDLAYLLKDSTGKYWIPKKLIHFGEKYTRQYSKFKIKYLKDKPC